jgi:hypothetical protein
MSVENVPRGKGRSVGLTIISLEQWYSTYFCYAFPDVIFFQLCTPKLLVFNSGYTYSIIYT